MPTYPFWSIFIRSTMAFEPFGVFWKEMEVPLLVDPDQFSAAFMAMPARASPLTNTESAFPVQYPPKFNAPIKSPATSGAGTESVPLFRKNRWMEPPQKALTVNPAFDAELSEFIWSGQIGFAVPMPKYAPDEEVMAEVLIHTSWTLSMSLFHMVALRLVVPPVRGYA